MKQLRVFLFILAVGVFGILNTEMGVIGILPAISEAFGVTVSKAGLLVSLFACFYFPSKPSFKRVRPLMRVSLGQAGLKRRKPFPSGPKMYPMSSQRWQS